MHRLSAGEQKLRQIIDYMSENADSYGSSSINGPRTTRMTSPSRIGIAELSDVKGFVG